MAGNVFATQIIKEKQRIQRRLVADAASNIGLDSESATKLGKAVTQVTDFGWRRRWVFANELADCKVGAADFDAIIDDYERQAVATALQTVTML